MHEDVDPVAGRELGRASGVIEVSMGTDDSANLGRFAADRPDGPVDRTRGTGQPGVDQGERLLGDEVDADAPEQDFEDVRGDLSG